MSANKVIRKHSSSSCSFDQYGKKNCISPDSSRRKFYFLGEIDLDINKLLLWQTQIEEKY